MADDGLDEKEVVLAFALREAVRSFTTHTPMTAEAVIKAMAFTIGSACGQTAAHSKHNTRQLRAMAIAAFDKGIDSARSDNRPKLIGLN